MNNIILKQYLLPKEIRQFHLVSNRPWPIMLSLLIIILLSNRVDVTLTELNISSKIWVESSILFLFIYSFI